MITDEILDGLEHGQWFKLRMAEDALNEQLEKAQAYLSDRRQLLDDKFEDKKRKLQQGDDLAPGVLKIVRSTGHQASHPAGRQDGRSSR